MQNTYHQIDASLREVRSSGQNDVRLTAIKSIQRGIPNLLLPAPKHKFWRQIPDCQFEDDKVKPEDYFKTI